MLRYRLYLSGFVFWIFCYIILQSPSCYIPKMATTPSPLQTLVFYCLWTVFTIVLLHFTYLTLSNKLTISIRQNRSFLRMGKIGEKHTKYQINKKDLSRRWSMFTYFCIGPNSPHCVMKKKNNKKIRAKVSIVGIPRTFVIFVQTTVKDGVIM